MTRYWTNFAKSGNPNTGGDVPATWPAFTGPANVLALDVVSGGGVTQLNTFETDHKCGTAWTAVTF
jgi:para-nitrobenzyl esterase